MAVPSNLSIDYDALLTTTLHGYTSTKLRDNICRGSKYLAWLDMKGRWRTQDGGDRVAVPLMYALNSSADIYSGYGSLDTTPQDGMTTAFYDWSQLAVAVAISRKEERQNSGKSRILNLLESKIMQAENSLKELVNNCLVAGRITASADLGRFLARQGRLDSGAQGPLPLAALIDSNASRSVSIGNINGSTYSWWRNTATDSASTTFAGLKLDMNKMYNDCSKGSGGQPDLLVGDQKAWETYWGALSSLERYVITDKKVIDILGGADALKFRGASFIWDEVVPDTKTNAEVVDAIGTVTLSTIFFINTETMEFISDSQTDFISTPMLRPVGQDARVGEILWMGAQGCNNRRKNGVLMGISQSIVS